MVIFAQLISKKVDMKQAILFTLTLLVLFITACKKEDKDTITGTVTFNFSPGAGDYYIFFDNDQDVTNGYIVQIIGTSTGPLSGFEYSFETKNIPAGSYYIRGGYDMESDDNMDPGNPLVWEGQGWYGSTSSNPPASPNVSTLYGNYDLMIYELGK